MPIFFENTGSVVNFIDDGIQVRPFVKFGDRNYAININDQISIITRIVLSQQANVQFLHALGSMVYIYTFGDRIGNVTLSGLAFDRWCENQGDDVQHGAEKMLAWYKTNRVTRRKSPIRLIIGKSTIIDGFVLSFNEGIIDPQVNLVQWDVHLATLPDEPPESPPEQAPSNDRKLVNKPPRETVNIKPAPINIKDRSAKIRPISNNTA